MAASGNQQPAVFGREHRGTEIDSRDRAARALAGAVLGFGDDDRGPAEPLLDASGDDPDVATMEGGGQAYNQGDATGFIRLNALRLKVRAAVAES